MKDGERIGTDTDDVASRWGGGDIESRQAYDTAPIGLAVLDAELRCRRVNARLAEMCGVPAAAFVGRPIYEVLPNCAASFLRLRDATVAGEPPATFEIEAEPAAQPGRRRVWAVSCAFLNDPHAHAGTAINMVVEDITDHKNVANDIQHVAELLELRVIERTAELKLEAQERQETERLLDQMQRVELIGQLTSGIAHDFNNMLGVIRANLEILSRRLGGRPADLRRFTDGAIAGVERAASLIRQLLGFARRQTLNPKPLDLKTRIVDMTELFRRTLGEKIVIETLLPDDVWPVQVDATQLENALLNLVINARDAMSGQGRVTIKVENVVFGDARNGEQSGAAPGEYLMISVIDIGAGMTPEIMALAFEPFFTTKAERGTGLGLAQVYAFAKQSGGHVAIASAPNEGTSVTMYLPRLTSAPPPKPDLPHELPTPAGTGRETVLVVEDDGNVRSATVDVLRDLGYAVISASDGEAALDLLADGTHVDLLFTDVGLPGAFSGPSLATIATARRPGLKTLFYSAYSDETTELDALRTGSILLKKPFTYAALAKTVRQALERSGDRPV